MKVAIYARVSTSKQDYDNQLLQLKEYIKNKDYELYKVYAETISGKEKDRAEFKSMLKDVTQHKFDAILVWSLDRFTREGTERVWYYLSLLKSFNVNFISYTEPYLNTDNDLVRDILYSVLGALAKQERIRMSERTKAGIQRARLKGKVVGRPSKVSKEVNQRIIEMRNQGKSYYEIANTLDLNPGVVYYSLNKKQTKKFAHIQ